MGGGGGAADGVNQRWCGRKIDAGGALDDQVKAAYIETTRLQPYMSVSEAYSAYRPGMRRCLVLPWSNSTWESVDMLRKIALVGVVVLVGRGSIAQLLLSIMLSFMFFSFHVKMWPMKTNVDNYFRAACEFHVFVTILVAFAMKSDLSHEKVTSEYYDWFLAGSLVVFVLGGGVVTVVLKLRKISTCVALCQKLGMPRHLPQGPQQASQ